MEYSKNLITLLSDRPEIKSVFFDENGDYYMHQNKVGSLKEVESDTILNKKKPEPETPAKAKGNGKGKT